MLPRNKKYGLVFGAGLNVDGSSVDIAFPISLYVYKRQGWLDISINVLIWYLTWTWQKKEGVTRASSVD